jgi:ADP-ribose pyrophosphatase YjhB (NUDIX family)
MRSESNAWRPAPFIRPISVGLVRRENQLLVMAARDDRGSIKGWRPVGGTIEFSESATDALRREFVEELGEEICNLQPVCVLENLYTHHGEAGHEIVFVFDATFVNAAAYQREGYEFVDGGIRNEVKWVDSADFLEGSQQLFPAALIQHLRGDV